MTSTARYLEFVLANRVTALAPTMIRPGNEEDVDRTSASYWQGVRDAWAVVVKAAREEAELEALKAAREEAGE